MSRQQQANFGPGGYPVQQYVQAQPYIQPAPGMPVQQPAVYQPPVYNAAPEGPPPPYSANPTPGMSHMTGQPIVVQTPQNMYPAPRPGNVPPPPPGYAPNVAQSLQMQGYYVQATPDPRAYSSSGVGINMGL